MKHEYTIIVLLGILVACGTAFSGCVNPGTNITPSVPNETVLPTPTAVHITAQPGDNVSVMYTGMMENGDVFESNINSTPVSFILGNSSVIEGFEEAVTGMAVNETKTVTIPYAKAYGPHLDDLVNLIPLMGPLENETFTVGTYVTITNKTDGSYSVVKILNVTPDTVTWDANDPLAGQNLTFLIKVTGIERK